MSGIVLEAGEMAATLIFVSFTNRVANWDQVSNTLLGSQWALEKEMLNEEMNLMVLVRQRKSLRMF